MECSHDLEVSIGAGIPANSVAALTLRGIEVGFRQRRLRKRGAADLTSAARAGRRSEKAGCKHGLKGCDPGDEIEAMHGGRGEHDRAVFGE